ncbi:MAG: hypothetical protein KDI79_11400 [Anaerolineae bacterium]|nr:hypothetical protein [Anaerolineae bacterium]
METQFVTTVTIKRLNDATGEVMATIAEHRFQLEHAGISMARYYAVAGQPYMLLLKRDAGPFQKNKPHIYRLNSNGALGELVNLAQPHLPPVDLGSGWTAANFLTVGHKACLVLHNAHTGRINLYQPLADGRLRLKSSYELNDLKHKDRFGLYAYQGKSYCFGLNTGTGEAVFYTVNGEKIGDNLFTPGWTSVDHLTVNGQTYRLLYKATHQPVSGADRPRHRAGRLAISHLSAQGLDSELIYDNVLPAGWTIARFFKLRDSYAIMLYNRHNGRYQIRHFGEWAGVGTVFHSGNIGAGWTDLEPYTMRDLPYLMALNEDSVDPVYVDDIDSLIAPKCTHQKKQPPPSTRRSGLPAPARLPGPNQPQQLSHVCP